MTMTKSEKPSFVLRNTSFTQRERWMPAIACSTCLSRSVLSCAAFFRLNRFMHLRFVALETGVLQQGYVVWVGNVFRFGDLLVMGLAWIGLAQIRNSFFLEGGNHDILLTMDFLLTTIVQSLFFRIFGSLTPPFGTVNDGICLFLNFFGSRSGSYPRSSKACFNTGNNVWIHSLACDWLIPNSSPIID